MKIFYVMWCFAAFGADVEASIILDPSPRNLKYSDLIWVRVARSFMVHRIRDYVSMNCLEC